MDILFISTSIPPYPDMQSIRNVFLIKGLERLGYKVTIVTSDYKWGHDDLINLLSDKTKIYRTKAPFFVRLSKLLSSHKGFSLVNKIFNIAINYVAIPDIHMFWNRKAKKLVKNLCEEGKSFDAVITSSGSYTAHIVGNWVSKTYQIPWVAEYGDPWGVNSFGEVKKFQFLIEKKIIEDCRGIVFTTQPTIDIHKPLFKGKFKYKLVPCGYEEIIEDSSERDKKEVINISYVGVAYASSRNLMHAIQSVSKSEYNVHLNMIGTFSKKYRDYVESVEKDRVTFMGRVSYQESLELMSKMDALLHIGNKGIMQVPGKTYIYLSSKKPIIYIKQEDELDPTYDILKKFDGIICCENNLNSITNAINKLADNYDYYKAMAEKRSESDILLSYKWENLSDEFGEFVREVIDEAKG